MIAIREVTDRDEKVRISKVIMGALPQWFYDPEDNEKKAEIHREYPLYVAFDGEEAVGLVSIKVHSPYTADVFTLAILESHHRLGIGHQLIDTCETYCKENGHTFLTVKTLDSSTVYKPYEGTRNFYKKKGFVPLEVFPKYWKNDNCLMLIKYLG